MRERIFFCGVLLEKGIYVIANVREKKRVKENYTKYTTKDVERIVIDLVSFLLYKPALSTQRQKDVFSMSKGQSELVYKVAVQC